MAEKDPKSGKNDGAALTFMPSPFVLSDAAQNQARRDQAQRHRPADIDPKSPLNDFIHFSRTDEIGRAQNFSYILKTGEIPHPTNPEQNLSVNWKANDPFTRSVATIRDKTIQEIGRSEKLQGLLHKKEWSRDDRVSWEKDVSRIVTEETGKIKGFDQYRTSEINFVGPNLTQVVVNGVNRASSLNQISDDIVKGTHGWEMDCEHFSIVKGAVLQQVDARLLPSGTDLSALKSAHNYFYVSGQNYMRGDGNPVSHAFIMSSATGNIIESTITPHGFAQALSSRSEYQGLLQSRDVAGGQKFKADLYERNHPYLESVDGKRFSEFLDTGVFREKKKGDVYGSMSWSQGMLINVYPHLPTGSDASKLGKTNPQIDQLVAIKTQAESLQKKGDEVGADKLKQDFVRYFQKNFQAINTELPDLLDAMLKPPSSVPTPRNPAVLQPGF